MILTEVILPELWVIIQGECACALVDEFKGHVHNDLKEHVKSFKSGSDDDEEEDVHNLVEWLTMAGGITPVGQPIDMILGEIMKGFYRDDYDAHMLDSPMRNGHQLTPSRQLCAQ